MIALGALEFFGDGVAQRFGSPGDGVLIDVGGDGLAGGFFDFGGAAKSGKPCARLTASCFSARRVISRITDSVNCSAFAESMRRPSWAMVVSGVVMGLH